MCFYVIPVKRNAKPKVKYSAMFDIAYFYGI